MKQRNLKLLSLIVFTLSLLMGCAAQRVQLPHRGAFVLDGRDYIAIPPSSLYPYAISQEDPIIKSLKTIFLQYTITDFDNLNLRDIDNGQKIPYTSKSLDDYNYQLDFGSNIPDGDYCLVLGDITKTVRDLTRWCFVIGDQTAISAEATAVYEMLEEKINVSPPSEGLFFVKDDLSVVEVPYTKKIKDFPDQSSYLNMPAAPSRMPVAILSSTNVVLDGFALYRAEYKLIAALYDESSPCEIENGDLWSTYFHPGDIIISVDGQDVTDCDQYLEVVATKIPASTVIIEVRRGTTEIKVPKIIDFATYNRTRSIELEIQFKDNYVGLIPITELSPGAYCFLQLRKLAASTEFDSKGYCFRVD